MANEKVTDLTSQVAVHDTDTYHVVNTADTSQDPAGSSYKIAWSVIKAAILGYFSGGTGITYSNGVISSDPTAVQTFTNKTLTSPTINTPTITSPSISGTITSTANITSSGSFTNNGSFAGTAILPIANGGTGQSTASGAINALVPTQAGNANKALLTDGTSVSWVAATLPTQTGNGGKFLTTDGSAASWSFLGYVAGVITDLATSGAGNNDVTITTTFTPRLIRLRYWIQGHTEATGSNIYVQSKGVGLFNGTTLVSNDVDWTFSATIDNASPSGGNASLSFITSPSNAGSITTGNANASQSISITVSIASVSSTSFVIRRATAINTSPATARASISYEAFA